MSHFTAGLPLGPDETEIELLGRRIRIRSGVSEAELRASIEVLERSFRDMEAAHALKWGCPPASMDTSTWVILGALNLAHRLVRSEQEASRHTRDLEQTLSRLLDDVSDLPSAPGPLFEGQDGGRAEP